MEGGRLSVVAVFAEANELHPQAFDGEAGEVAEAGEGGGVEVAGEVLDLAAGEAPRVRVRIGAAIIACRAVAVGELGGEPAADQRLEGLVDGGEGDIWDHGADGGEDVVRGGVLIGLAEKPVHGRPLVGEALATGFQRRPEEGVGVVRVVCVRIHGSRRVVPRRMR